MARSDPADSAADPPDSGAALPASSEASRAADRWLVEHLRSTGYDLGHPHTQAFADHLYNYGVGTLIELHKSGTLFASCRRRTRGGLSRAPATWGVEARRVICETVCAAIERFIVESVPRWDSEQSSITTYFVNYCLLRFKTHYERFCREEAHVDTERPVDNIVDMQVAREGGRVDTENTAIARAMHDEVTGHVRNPLFTRYLQLALVGMKQREIAVELGLSESALSRQLARWRETVKASGWPAREGG